MADYTFVIYKMEVTAVHGRPVIVPLVSWTHDLESMVQAVTPRTRLLFLCNPNNPTGTMVSAEAVDRFMAADAVTVERKLSNPAVIAVSERALARPNQPATGLWV